MPTNKGEYIAKEYLSGSLDQFAIMIVKDVVDQVDKKFELYFRAVHQDILQIREEMATKEDLVKVKNELRNELSQAKAELQVDIADLKSIQSAKVKRADRHGEKLESHENRIASLESIARS